MSRRRPIAELGLQRTAKQELFAHAGEQWPPWQIGGCWRLGTSRELASRLGLEVPAASGCFELTSNQKTSNIGSVAAIPRAMAIANGFPSGANWSRSGTENSHASKTAAKANPPSTMTAMAKPFVRSGAESISINFRASRFGCGSGRGKRPHLDDSPTAGLHWPVRNRRNFFKLCIRRSGRPSGFNVGWAMLPVKSIVTWRRARSFVYLFYFVRVVFTWQQQV